MNDPTYKRDMIILGVLVAILLGLFVAILKT